MEIHQNGRAIWWVRFQTSFWGAPGIFIEGLPVVSPRMVMGGGKSGGGGGGGGGGKGKLGAMGEEGGKRRVLAVSFDSLFFLLFFFSFFRSFYLQSFLVPSSLTHPISFLCLFASSSHSKDKNKTILSLTTLPTDH